MRLLFLGDIVGRPGVMALKQHLVDIRRAHQIDCVIANAENAADGSGLTLRQFDLLRGCGVDGITMGDHIYKKREIYARLGDESPIVKPANFPATAPGQPWWVLPAEEQRPGVAFISLLGRIHTRPVDCPFQAVDRVLEEIPDEVRIRIVDIHAEATSEKQTMGRYLDGRVTAVLGTHTHVPTADTMILPGGTGFQCDVGMTGPYHSIIGRDIDRVLTTTTTFQPVHFYVATADVRICGAIIDADPLRGTCLRIERFQFAVPPG